MSGGARRPVAIPGFAVIRLGWGCPVERGHQRVTIPGFAVSFGLDVPLSGGANAVTIPGFAVIRLGWNVPLSRAPRPPSFQIL